MRYIRVFFCFLFFFLNYFLGYYSFILCKCMFINLSTATMEIIFHRAVLVNKRFKIVIITYQVFSQLAHFETNNSMKICIAVYLFLYFTSHDGTN